MHTMECGKLRFQYNSDLSGEVHIIIIKTGERFTIPEGEDLVEFVGEWVREQRIGKLEQMDVNEVLGIEEL